jgi:hypothetical protein
MTLSSKGKVDAVELPEHIKAAIKALVQTSIQGGSQ